MNASVVRRWIDGLVSDTLVIGSIGIRGSWSGLVPECFRKLEEFLVVRITGGHSEGI